VPFCLAQVNTNNALDQRHSGNQAFWNHLPKTPASPVPMGLPRGEDQVQVFRGKPFGGKRAILVALVISWLRAQGIEAEVDWQAELGRLRIGV